MKKFQFILKCILAFMLYSKICFDINIRSMSRTLEYKAKLLNNLQRFKCYLNQPTVVAPEGVTNENTNTDIR